MSAAHELVRDWLEAVDHGRTGQLNPSCDPTKVYDDTHVWCTTHKDLDYEQAYLLEVSTHHPVGATTVTVVDYLAAYNRHDKLDVEWFNEPRLFFDRDLDYHEQVDEWFVGWLYDIQRQRNDDWDKGRTAEQIASLEEYNEKVRQAERDRAASIGIHLPVRGEPTSREQLLSNLAKKFQNS